MNAPKSEKWFKKELYYARHLESLAWLQKISEGCDHCYMYYLDRKNNKNGADIYRTKTGFNVPIQKDRQRHYKIKIGELIRVCMTSDFFLEVADPWREEAWQIIRERSDVKFFLLTKRPERVKDCLPQNWGDGWENVFFNVTCENQKRADERIPMLRELPFKHKGIMCAPFIGAVQIEKYLDKGQIKQVICGGENYDGARTCNFDWVKSLSRQCIDHHVNFCFIETETNFIKDGKLYRLKKKQLQSEMATKAGVSLEGKPNEFRLTDSYGQKITAANLYRPYFCEDCLKCGSRQICNGCSDYGKCRGKILTSLEGM